MSLALINLSELFNSSYLNADTIFKEIVDRRLAESELWWFLAQVFPLKLNRSGWTLSFGESPFLQNLIRLRDTWRALIDSTWGLLNEWIRNQGFASILAHAFPQPLRLLSFGLGAFCKEVDGLAEFLSAWEISLLVFWQRKGFTSRHVLSASLRRERSHKL